MKYLILLILTLFAISSFSQDNNEKINLNVLQAPVSPAANLLEISNSEIQKPTDPAGFMALINQSRDAGSFAVDFAPYWLFAGDKITLEDYINNDRNFQNSFVISLATRMDEIDINNILQNKRQVSIGFKFSPERGDLSEKTKEAIKKHLVILKKTSNEWSELLQNSLNSDEIYNKVKAEYDEMWRNDDIPFETKNELKTIYTSRLAEIETRVIKEIESLSKEEVEEIEFERVGNKIDISGGLVYDALESNFSNGDVIKGGVWATYELSNLSKNGPSLIFLVRYLLNPELSFTDESGVVMQEDVNNIDLGARLYYQKSNNPLSVSFEWIYRDYNDKVVEDGSRYSLNIAYDIGSNNQLSLALGKNYDGTITRDDNLIAALNLLIGLATTKKAY